MEPKAFEIYRHFKGNLYQIIALAEEERTGNMLVVYQGLYAPFKVYARPLSEFLERLDRLKYPNAAQGYRFERVTEAEPATGILSERPTVDAVAGRLSEEQADVPAEILPERPVTDAVAGRLPEEQSEAPVEILPESPASDVSAGGINPDLLLFLDAREPEDKLDALFRIKSRLTSDMLTAMEMSQGMEPQEEWSIEERYKHIKNDIITKQKYEQKRI